MRFYKFTGLFIAFLILFAAFFSCKSNSNPINPPIPVTTQLEGTWAGKNTDGIDPTNYTYKIHLDSIIDSADGVEKYRGTFTLDTAISPTQINIIITKSDSASWLGKTILALYTLSGNVLLITNNNPGSERPLSIDPPTSVIRFLLQ